jgi:hypothetical protein
LILLIKYIKFRGQRDLDDVNASLPAHYNGYLEASIPILYNGYIGTSIPDHKQ